MNRFVLMVRGSWGKTKARLTGRSPVQIQIETFCDTCYLLVATLISRLKARDGPGSAPSLSSCSILPITISRATPCSCCRWAR